MNKNQLINQISRELNLPKKEVEVVINSMLETIIESLKYKEPVSLYRFGSFFPKKRYPREIYIPGTKEKILTKKSYGVIFKISKTIKIG